MKTIKVHFLDIQSWPGLYDNNIFLYCLQKNYNVEFDSQNPDVLIYGIYYNEHLKYQNCLKIFVTGEPNPWGKDIIALDRGPQSTLGKNDRGRLAFEDANYVVSSYYPTDSNMFRFPIYLVYLYYHLYVTKYTTMEKLLTFKNFTKNDIKDRNFCMFMYSHYSEKRDSIFKKLLKHKRIDSGGLHIPNMRSVPLDQNITGWLNKIDSIRNYKFCFGFENFYYKEQNAIHSGWLDGQISEKIIEPYIANCVPLYYGNVLFVLNSSPILSLNWHDFNDDEKYINRILEVDGDENLYLEYLNQPTYNFNAFEHHTNKLAKYFNNIIG